MAAQILGYWRIPYKWNVIGAVLAGIQTLAL
jgi:hypothetical protein